MPQPRKNSKKPATTENVAPAPIVEEVVVSMETPVEVPVLEASPEPTTSEVPVQPMNVSYRNSTGRTAEISVGGNNYRIPANETITVASHLENELLTATRHTGRWVKQK